jgi:hypothetical protein
MYLIGIPTICAGLLKAVVFLALKVLSAMAQRALKGVYL